jgi:SPP1 gp7 family putative phage head morphogenesis protein
MNSIFEQQKQDCIAYTNSLSGEKSLTSDLETILDGYTKQIVEQLNDPITQIFGIAGQEALQQINFSGVFNVTNPEVIKFIDKYLLKLSGVLNDTTLIAVKNIIKEGLTDGSTIQEIADRINASPEFSPVRSTMIARTETANSYINGEIVAWKQSGVVDRKQWISSPGACDICKALNGKQVGLDEKFGEGWFNSLPHPSCRCDNLAILS